MAGLAVASAVLAVAACGAPADKGVTAVRVTMGSVARTVSATGTLQAVTQQNVGFVKGGKLAALTVAVGQQVNAGQVLAKLDDFYAQADLREAQAKLSGARAALDRIKDSNKADAAQDDYRRAKEVLAASKDAADTVQAANQAALEQAQRQFDQDRDQLQRRQAAAQLDQARCNQSLTGNSHRYDGYGDNAGVQSRGGKGLLLENPLDLHSPSCVRSDRGKAEVAGLRSRIQADQEALSRLQRQQDVQQAQRKIAVDNAQRDATAAGNAAVGAATDAPHEIDEQADVLRDAQTDVDRAQRQVRDTTLVAPVAGRVSSINGAVGEFIGSGGRPTPLAPGGAVPLPDTASRTSSGTDSSGETQPPGAGSFITLSDVNSFQVVVPFEEADAAKVGPNQRVEVTFDALPGLTRAGTLATIAPTGTQIQDVTNYYATVVLNQIDPRLASGMTAEVKVEVGGVRNVLVVPTSAVIRAGDTGVVMVLQPDGTTRRTQIRLGLVGDRTAQVVGGLTEGQQVVVAQS
jgi:HlyD family secretion protein